MLDLPLRYSLTTVVHTDYKSVWRGSSVPQLTFVYLGGLPSVTVQYSVVKTATMSYDLIWPSHAKLETTHFR